VSNLILTALIVVERQESARSLKLGVLVDFIGDLDNSWSSTELCCGKLTTYNGTGCFVG